MSDKFADRWRFIPEKNVDIIPKNGFCQIIRDQWWVICPERGLAFFWTKKVKGLGSPQCNSNEIISRRLGTTIPNAEIKYIPLVIVPIHIGDYEW